ncbi:transmembrane protein 225 [Phascolarctos cinereus]|uniref:Transmembrane protein 225 isoform X2 n=2 Tax=Phascolarctos cinereus TaxID=38626 RepID=A0A6P5K5W1_PHACI|nr:transmembrane protein 225 isoform X2 [Phascolarctos cinereus]
MILGLVQKEWVKLEGLPSRKSIFSSPWIPCINSNCTMVDLTDDKKTWNLMAITITLSIVLCFMLCLDYTYIIPRIKSRYLFFAFISFLTGICLFTAIILYYQELRKSFNMYYHDIKVTWIFHSSYIIIFLYLVCGILCLLSHRECNKSSLDLLEESPTQSPLRQPESIQMKTDDKEMKGNFSDKVHIENLSNTSLSPPRKSQALHVTWAV